MWIYFWRSIARLLAGGSLALACSSTTDQPSDTAMPSSENAQAGSSSSVDPTTTMAVCTADSASIQRDIFKIGCAGAGCHGSQQPAAGLDLVDAPLDALKGTSSALCNGWSLVVPGSLEKSLLYQKLTASMPPCGEPMPVAGHLSTASSKCIADWIVGMASGGGCEKCGGTDCVALASDPKNCGACGSACPSGVACENGACVCASGAMVCAGACIDVSGDPNNCGKCGNTCSAGNACVSGQCKCAGALQACSGACVDLVSDGSNCGKCGNACGAGQVCLAGQCSSNCGNLTQCLSSCVDVQNNTLNCGKCGNVCSSGLSCTVGQCGCPNGGQLCGTACTDTKTDAKNCGQCGYTCAAGEACVSGSCQCNASGSVSFKNDVSPILSAGCTAAGCHVGTKPKEDLDLSVGKSFGELVNVASSECNGSRKLVVPGNPGASYLLQKLLGVNLCTGSQMPKAGQSLPQAQIDAISAWICSGAPNN